MRFLFYLGHPHHYHTVRPVVDELVDLGHEILFMARHKDVLLELLATQEHPVRVISRREIRSPVVGRALNILNRELAIFRTGRTWKPDVLVGTDIVITHVGRLLGIPSVVLDEDDTAIVPLMGHLGFRFADRIVAPSSCDLGRYEHKKIAYAGVQELSYLHPDRFRADPAVVRTYGLEPGGYVLLRLARLSAHHDWGKRGIDDDLARAIVARIGVHCEVRISAERSLPEDLTDRRLTVDPAELHHLLGHARALVGDSQTMTIEAAVLGVPAIRYSDFVGRIGCVRELESRYRLAIGVRPGDPAQLLETLEQIVSGDGVRERWQQRRERLLEETDDVCRLLREVLVESATKRPRQPGPSPMAAHVARAAATGAPGIDGGEIADGAATETDDDPCPRTLLERDGRPIPPTPAYKRPLDLLILLSSHMLLLPLFASLWLGIPLLIYLRDGRPVLYRTTKLGKGGRRIPVLKFRTMVRDADRIGPSFTVPGDPRVTPFGRWLRKTGLDELPQLISIARGDMSFVGPRPYNPRSFRMYQRELPDFHERLRVLPGLTGLAAVHGDPADPRDRLDLDLRYVREGGPWLDVKLLFASAWIGLTGGWERKQDPDQLPGR